MEKQETTEKCTVGTPIGNLVLEPISEDIFSINTPKITEIRIQIGDDYATYKDCASLQELLDDVREYVLLRKALDVAIDALKRLRDVPDEDNDKWFNYCCPTCVLQEISEIIGGK